MDKFTSALMGNHSLMPGINYEEEGGGQGEEEAENKKK